MFGVGGDFSGVDVEEAEVGLLGGFGEFFVGAAGGVDEADVVIFAVEAAEDGFVVPGEPPVADVAVEGGGLFDEVAVGVTAASSWSLAWTRPAPRPFSGTPMWYSVTMTGRPVRRAVRSICLVGSYS